MKKFLSLAFCMVMMLGLTRISFAAETGTATEAVAEKSIDEQRRVDLDYFYQTLNAAHPNIFSVNPESTFLSKLETIYETAGEMDDVTFALNLQSVIALVGDSHTSVSLSSGSLDFYTFAVEYYDGVPVLIAAPKEYEHLLGKEVLRINGIPIQEVVERFRGFISHDNDVALRRHFTQMLPAVEILAYLGVTEPGADITVTVMDSEPVDIPLSPVAASEMSGMRTSSGVLRTDETKLRVGSNNYE